MSVGSLVAGMGYLPGLGGALDDDQVGGVALDDLLDRVDLVAGHDEEAVERGAHLLVAGDRELDGGVAADVAALADEDGAVAVGPAALDRLVDAATVDLGNCRAP